MKKFIFIIFLLSLSILFAQQNYNLNFTTISCVLHIHSNFSSGKNSIEEILDLARQYNIDCVVMTDHFLRKVEYGLWPFRGIIKKSVSLPSVMKLGVEKYLSKIEEINKKQKDVIVIPGLEITPHYFWSIEENSLVINNLHKHMLIIGLDKKNLFYFLPVIGNEADAGKIKILSFWPVVFILLGLFLKSKFLVIISIILLGLNYPFKSLPFEQYKSYFELPYQYLINFINSIPQDCGITPLIVWAHPEATNYEKKVLLKKIRGLSISTQTKPYCGSLLKTYDYDGFAIFAEGYRQAGGECNIWDEILNEYCKGVRKRPVFCYSEVDYGESTDELFVKKNILYVRQKDYKNILLALKKGNFYSLWRDKEKELVLENFRFCDEKAIFGEIYNKNVDKIKISFDVKFNPETKNNKKIVVRIIKNGNVVFTKEGYDYVNVFFEEEKPKTKSYYRIFIESEYPNMIATNPMFVE